MTFGLTLGLVIIYGLLYYVFFYVFFPKKEGMTPEQAKNRRYNKIGFWSVLTLMSFGVAFVADSAYTTAFIFSPILCTSYLIGHHYHKSMK